MNEIRAAFERRGHETYGEGISQLDHALQCAAFAERLAIEPAEYTLLILMPPMNATRPSTTSSLR